jgi:ligand-binding sensor domain-containing protein
MHNSIHGVQRLPLVLAILAALAPWWAACQRADDHRTNGEPAQQPLILPRPILHHRPTPRPGHRVSAVHHGSPHPARAALQLPDGQTWVATPGGILRFDGRLWTDPARATPVGRVGVAQGLPAARVNDLARAADGGVWAATDAGLVRLDRLGLVRAEHLLSGRRVTALAGGWIGTWRGLVQRRRPHATVPGSEALAVTDLLACGAAGTLVATHASGLWLLDRRGVLRRLAGLADVRVGRLAGCQRPARRSAWAASMLGLFRVDLDQLRAHPVSAWRQHASQVATDRAGRVLLGTFGAGVQRLEGGRLAPLASNGRVSLLFAGPGGAWLVGTDERLTVVRPDGREVPLPVQGPPPGPVTALAPTPGGLWVGTFDQGLARLRRGRWERWSVGERRITALLSDSGGRLWVGTARGLFHRRGRGFARVRDPRGWLKRHVNAVREGAGRLWFAVYPGLVTLDTRRRPWRFVYLGATGAEADRGLVGPTVYGVAFSRGGRRAWIGSDDGLSRLRTMTERGRASNLTDLGGALPDNWINDVRAAPDGIYVLTLRSGLLRVGQRTEVIHADLMTSPSVLLPLGAGAIFGTNSRGLAVLRDTAARTPTLAVLGPAQGITSRLVTALAHEPTRDRLWIGGEAGVERLDAATTALGLNTTKGDDR